MADIKEGLVHIYTGKGKGKTTAGVGAVLRAAGAGFKICFIQFLKGSTSPNEMKMLKKLGKKCTVIRFKEVHPMFFPKKKRKAAAGKLKMQVLGDFKKAKKIILSKKYDVVVMDEIINIVGQNFMPENQLVQLIKVKPKNVELVLTGRGASKKLMKKADYVTEMRFVKHPFYRGKKSRKGFEY